MTQLSSLTHQWVTTGLYHPSSHHDLKLSSSVLPTTLHDVQNSFLTLVFSLHFSSRNRKTKRFGEQRWMSKPQQLILQRQCQKLLKLHNPPSFQCTFNPAVFFPSNTETKTPENSGFERQRIYLTSMPPNNNHM